MLDAVYGGVNLGSNITNLPLGYKGPASDNGAALIAGAGKFNLDIPTDLQGLDRGLLTSPETNSFNVNIRREFNDIFDLYADYSHFENHGLSYSANQIPTTVTLAANAPTNPFQQNIRVSFASPGLAYPYESKSVTNTLAVGGIFRLPHKWSLSVEYHRDWVSSSASFYQSVVDAVGASCALSGTAPSACPSSIGGSPTDMRPLLDPLQAPIDFDPFAFTSPTFVQGPYRSTMDNPSLRASGPLFRMAGGNAVLTLAVQREALSIKRSMNVITQPSTRQPLYVIFNPRRQSTTSEYGEIVLPFVAKEQALPLLHELELTAAIRHDAYQTVSPPAAVSSISVPDPADALPAYTDLRTNFDSVNYTLTGKWSPVAGVALRASYATGFLPPSVVQLASSSGSAPFGLGIPDPFRGNEIISYPITSIGGTGNTALRPEKSRSLSFGAILTPFDGARVSVDYSLIRKNDEIGGIPLQYLLANPDLFPDRVVRSSPLPGDPTGYRGRIVSIDTSPVNLLRSRFKSVDIQADYETDLGSAGKLRLYALASYQPDTKRQLIVGSPILNYSGNADGPLKWQGNGGIDWTIGGWSVQWNTQFYSHYNVYSTQDVSTTTGAAVVAAAIGLQGSARIPSQNYSDLYVSYRFDSDSPVLRGLKISAGIQNIFDQKPPVRAIQSYTQAGYSTYGDPRLRRFTLTLRKAFGGR